MPIVRSIISCIAAVGFLAACSSSDESAQCEQAVVIDGEVFYLDRASNVTGSPRDRGPLLGSVSASGCPAPDGDLTATGLAEGSEVRRLAADPTNRRVVVESAESVLVFASERTETALEQWMGVLERIEVRDIADGRTVLGTVTDPDAMRLVASAVIAGEPRSVVDESFGAGDPAHLAFVGPSGLVEVVAVDLEQGRTVDGRELPPEVVEVLNSAG